ncbi:MAG: hypothetical protein WBW80_21255 [Acidimicrobiales bacterium]
MTAGLIVEAWMQHPSQAMLADPMFDSLRAWSRGSLLEVDLPIEWTLTAMHEAGVELGLLCAWWGPGGPIIGNDEVAEIVARYPDRFIHRPMEAVRELRRCVGVLDFRALRVVPWLWDLPPAITEPSEVVLPSLRRYSGRTTVRGVATYD